MKKIFKNEIGITLVALVVTIIILLILAGVAISTLVNNGIIDKAKTATQEYKNAQDYEETQIAKYTNEIDSHISGNRDYETEINKLKARITELENVNSYSTTEKVVGTWINGKKLYQKSIMLNSLPNNNSNTPINLGNDIENCNIIGGFAKNTNGYNYPINYIYSTTEFIFADVTDNGQNLFMKFEGTTAFTKFILHFQYTKTTD